MLSPTRELAAKVDDRFNVVLGEQLGQQCLVAQVALIQLAAQQRLAVSCQQIVDYYHFFAAVQKLCYCVGADISCPARYQNRHNYFSPFSSSTPLPMRAYIELAGQAGSLPCKLRRLR
jgi:hypothetical protein